MIFREGHRGCALSPRPESLKCPLPQAGAADRAMDSYLACVRSTLDAALCIRNFAAEDVERHNRPEVEMRFVSP